MKKIFTLTALACIATTGAYAADCNIIIGDCSNWGNVIGSASNCASTNDQCYSDSGAYQYRVISCGSCTNGATRTANRQILPGCATTVDYYTCDGGDTPGLQPGGGSGSCPSNCNYANWTAGNTGYEKKCNTSTYTCQYRCAPGYYGTSTTGTTGCTRCPALLRTGENYSTSAGGVSTIDRCYMPLGSPFSDLFGQGVYTSDCPYGGLGGGELIPNL